VAKCEQKFDDFFEARIEGLHKTHQIDALHEDIGQLFKQKSFQITNFFLNK